MKAYERNISDRDKQILAFVNRYRIGTEELLAKAVFEEGTQPKNIRRVCLRLEKRKLLRRESWDKGLWYYVITTRGCRVLESTARTPSALSEQALAARLAEAYYCVNHEELRLTADEFRSRYPGLSEPGRKCSSYVLAGSSDDFKLEMLVTDRGGAARRIAHRVRRCVRQRSSLPDFVWLMNKGLFQINVLTGTDIQKRKIDHQLAKHDFTPVHVRVTVIPELADILLLRK